MLKENQNEKHLEAFTEDEKKMIRLMAKIAVKNILKEADKQKDLQLPYTSIIDSAEWKISLISY